MLVKCTQEKKCLMHCAVDLMKSGVVILRPKKNFSRKPEVPAEFELQVQSLIQSQQELLKSMIETEVFPGTRFDSANKVDSNSKEAS